MGRIYLVECILITDQYGLIRTDCILLLLFLGVEFNIPQLPYRTMTLLLLNWCPKCISYEPVWTSIVNEFGVYNLERLERNTMALILTMIMGRWAATVISCVIIGQYNNIFNSFILGGQRSGLVKCYYLAYYERNKTSWYVLSSPTTGLCWGIRA